MNLFLPPKVVFVNYLKSDGGEAKLVTVVAVIVMSHYLHITVVVNVATTANVEMSLDMPWSLLSMSAFLASQPIIGFTSSCV